MGIEQRIADAGTGVTELDLPSWTVQAGEVISLHVALSGNKSATITGHGLTWTEVLRIPQGGTQGVTAIIYRAQATASDTDQINIDVGSTTAITADAVRVSGLDTADLVEATGSGTGNSTSPLASLTPVNDDCWIFGVIAHESEDFSIGAGFTAGTLNQEAGGGSFITQLSTEHLQQGTAAAEDVDGTLDAAENWAVAAVAYNVVSAVSKSVSDTGGGSDAVDSLAATLDLIEAGAGLDEIGQAVVDAPVNDAGGGSDSLPSLNASLSLAEAGGGLDALASLAAALNVPEAGAGADVVGQLAAALSVSGAGGGSDSLGGANAALSLADVGSGAESPTLNVNLTVSDAGAGAGNVNLTTALLKAVSDVASGLDSIAQASVALSLADAGLGSGSVGITAALNLADSANSSDVINVLQAILIAVSEVANGSDSIPSIDVSLSLADAGAGSDSVPIFVSLSLADAGAGADVIAGIVTAVLITAVDAGGGSDSIAGLGASLSLAEVGGGLGSVSSGVSLMVSDSGQGVASLVASVAAAVADSAASSDVLGSVTVYVPLAEFGNASDIIAQITAALSLADAGAGADVITKLTDQGVATFTFVFKRRRLTFSNFVSRAISFVFKPSGS